MLVNTNERPEQLLHLEQSTNIDLRRKSLTFDDGVQRDLQAPRQENERLRASQSTWDQAALSAIEEMQRLQQQPSEQTSVKANEHQADAQTTYIIRNRVLGKLLQICATEDYAASDIPPFLDDLTAMLRTRADDSPFTGVAAPDSDRTLVLTQGIPWADFSWTDPLGDKISALRMIYLSIGSFSTGAEACESPEWVESILLRIEKQVLPLMDATVAEDSVSLCAVTVPFAGHLLMQLFARVINRSIVTTTQEETGPETTIAIDVVDEGGYQMASSNTSSARDSETLWPLVVAHVLMLVGAFHRRVKFSAETRNAFTRRLQDNHAYFERSLVVSAARLRALCDFDELEVAQEICTNDLRMAQNSDLSRPTWGKATSVAAVLRFLCDNHSQDEGHSFLKGKLGDRKLVVCKDHIGEFVFAEHQDKWTVCRPHLEETGFFMAEVTTGGVGFYYGSERAEKFLSDQSYLNPNELENDPIAEYLLPLYAEEINARLPEMYQKTDTGISKKVQDIMEGIQDW